MTTVTVHPDPASASPATASAPPPAPVVETPSQSVVNRATQFVKVQDVFGRTIGIKKPNAAERMRLMRVLGPELSENQVYFGHAMLAACVREFDGELLPAAASPAQLEHLVSRLDDEGLNAIAKGLSEHFNVGRAPGEDALAAAKN